MAGVRVTIQDTMGTATHSAELPHDITMRRLIPALVTRLRLPILGADSQPISYRLYFDGREIGQEQTLEQAGVRDSSVLSLSQEATAGGWR
ncbi:MAG TPA: EsaB/YukD family protein [Thermoanaerobaculia bacterium]|nr:EsaB/YukD family protein [Thermoanaerobaculia bacterium]